MAEPIDDIPEAPTLPEAVPAPAAPETDEDSGAVAPRRSRGSNDKVARRPPKRRRHGIEDVTSDLGATLIWNAKVESILYYRHRLWAQRMGPTKHAGPHNYKLPAVLMPEQTALAFGFADETRRRSEESSALAASWPETLNDVVHADLASKGYVVSSACRYGGDFVIYEAHPSVCHSSDAIRVLEPDEHIEAPDLAGYCRVQGSVLKRAVFATVAPRSRAPQYVGFSFNPALSTDTMKKLERRLSRAIVESPRSPASPGAPALGSSPAFDTPASAASATGLDADVDDDEEAGPAGVPLAEPAFDAVVPDDDDDEEERALAGAADDEDDVEAQEDDH